MLYITVAAAGVWWIPPIRVGIAPPPAEDISRFTQASQFSKQCNYPGSVDSIPPFWFINQSHRQIGHGRDAFRRASEVLDTLKLLNLGWLTHFLHGDTLSICSRQFGIIWMMNANRLIDRRESYDQCSVTWGTTRRHVLAGEERLSVKWDRASDEVTFEILSFSRPRHAFSWLAYPYVVAQQKRFANDASAMMVKAAGTIS